MRIISPRENVRFDCGVFDSDIEYANVKRSPSRTVKYFEIELIIDCTGTAHLDGVTQKLRPQMLQLSKPGQTRSSTFGFKCYYIHYHLEKTSKFYPLLMSFPNFYFILNANRYLKIWEDLIYFVNVKNYDVDSDIVAAKLTELFFYMSEDATPNRNYAAASHNTAIPDSVKYIDGHLDEKLDLKFLAEQVSYSPNHYQRVFKAVMGSTPCEYILQARINAAKQLLNDPTANLIDIALQCGFSSQSYFNYVFKKETELTPLEYRKICKKHFF